MISLTRKSKDQVLIIHDEGEPEMIRKLARRSRRFGTAGSLFGGSRLLPFKGLIDDPVARNSRQSYFLQLADLDAYAAFSRTHPPPAHKASMVPQLMWEELGEARFRQANKRAGGPSDGIVLWPK